MSFLIQSFHFSRCRTKGVLPSRSEYSLMSWFLLAYAWAPCHLWVLGLPFWKKLNLTLFFNLRYLCKSNLVWNYFLTNILFYQALLGRAAGFSARSTEGLDHGPLAKARVPEHQWVPEVQAPSRAAVPSPTIWSRVWLSVQSGLLGILYVDSVYITVLYRGSVLPCMRAELYLWWQCTLQQCWGWVYTPYYSKQFLQAPCTVLFSRVWLFANSFDECCMLAQFSVLSHVWSSVNSNSTNIVYLSSMFTITSWKPSVLWACILLIGLYINSVFYWSDWLVSLASCTLSGSIINVLPDREHWYSVHLKLYNAPSVMWPFMYIFASCRVLSVSLLKKGRYLGSFHFWLVHTSREVMTVNCSVFLFYDVVFISVGIAHSLCIPL